ncbi:LacI family DNA-binding transcriptional regulator [Phyllobacterium endophyticum]|uniref:LacI family transcriptional regulator n=1 Tax=Phyllobacterium endophyticum TaxID=1149773 RepID=A0A2P7ARJ3_9HYPH|nr:LacI family DNA-binding transcriptional regulator [Phyllobacterium endophyticum]PSH56852.1 LacI family transcriptional regulator [Phyllobacterium endophyticum]TYR39721.1 LacI family DNA-binding transcriptional regulator [Phyllobacterium endophyticum]
MTLEDVAREAGVSLATVDRVVNGRIGVHARTIERVNAAIKQLGFLPDPHASRLARGRDYDFRIILPKGENEFMRALGEEFSATRERQLQERVRLSIQHVDTFDGEALAAALERLPGGIDGVAVVALDHPAVTEAINALADAGVVVLTLVSDVPNSRRAHYVGIDNFAAGRTAASLIGRFVGPRRGKVGMIAGSLALRDHVERQFGFEQILSREYSNLEVLPVREARDENARVEAVSRSLLQDHPDLVAIYNAGGGQAGVIAALEATNRVGDVIFVAHELTASTRRHLVRGTVDAIINQDAGHMARSAARILTALREGRPIVPGQEHIRIDIFIRDNMP